ncbi:hypothetical protein [Antarcticirhabdus aurantiaca]|uniref:Uncharacterized protein n=1 Tax=Antarcticirhabdus aurantiaca TaxID=2606717 RepID=A0ACD4NU03_9HYPH|nr:hypothetical protein [Antarcticirhabdus aurantiaca]WAJ30345.1 hypothetical protein OXU80_09135 [Jeongeuplla avenae]
MLLPVCAVLLGAVPALAALPPGAQRAKEIAAVVEAAALRLDRPIESVRLIEPFRYDVQAGPCHLEVRIIALPPKPENGPAPPGPMPFRAVAGEPDCRP